MLLSQVQLPSPAAQFPLYAGVSIVVSSLDTDPQKMLCYCLGVRYGRVVQACREDQCKTVAQVTRSCKAGGGCRSCHPEIEEVIRDAALAKKAQRQREGFFARILSLFKRS